MSIKPEIILAKERGFCSGVRRAIDIVEDSLDNISGELYVLNEIVHNKTVVSRLSNKGVHFVKSLDVVPEGCSLIFSAHGVAPAVRQQAKDKGLQIIDATCPLVELVHKRARQYQQSGYQILYIGHSGHDEVVGVLGECDHNEILLIEDINQAKNIINTPGFDANKKTVWLSQTTLSVNDTREIVVTLHDLVPNLEDPESECICLATTQRQSATSELVEEVGDKGLIIVVGSKNSSNSVRLADLARSFSRSNDLNIDVIQIDGPDELDLDWALTHSKIGVTSGASVPEDITSSVVELLMSN
jgi:4-hydroxy-3-methylbut-2-enyl diphosphate reductase